MKKKFLSVLLTLTMVLAMVPATAFAVDDTQKVEGTEQSEGEEDTDEEIDAQADPVKVAQIGENTEKQYETLAAAVAAADSGDTIKLLDDVTVDAVVSTDKNITLDLNSHTLTNSKTATGNYTIKVTGGTLTIIDTIGGGSVTNGTEKASTIDVSVGTLIVGDGTNDDFTLTNGGKKIVENSVIKVEETATKLEIKGGTVEATTYDDSENKGEERSIQTFGPNTIISGGTIEGAVELWTWTGGQEYPSKVTVSGGKLNGGITVSSIIDKGDDVRPKLNSKYEIEITGGTVAGLFTDFNNDKETQLNTEKVKISDGTITKGTEKNSYKSFTDAQIKECLVAGKTLNDKGEVIDQTYTKPTPVAAILHDEAEDNAIADKDLYATYDVDVTEGTDYDTVKITATDLRKHTNGSKAPGYWVGFALAAPEGAVSVKKAVAPDLKSIGALADDSLEERVVVDGDKAISGYTFYTNADPSISDAKKYARIQWIDKAGNAIEIDGVETFDYKIELDVKVVPDSAVVKPAANVTLPETLNENATATAAKTAIDTALENSTEVAENTKLAEAAKSDTTALKEAGSTEVSAAKLDELKKVDTTVTGAADVSVVVQPYIDIKITDASSKPADGDKPAEVVLKVDITPMYRLVATKSTNANDDAPLKTEGSDINAVVISDPKPLTITEETIVKIPVGEIFGGAGTKVYIKHYDDQGNYKETYEGVVKDDENPKYVEFTTNGFCPYELSLTNDSVAKIDDKFYESLQAAVDRVEDGGTITLLKTVSNEEIEVKAAKTFTIAGLSDTIKLENVTFVGANGVSVSYDEATHKVTAIATKKEYKLEVTNTEDDYTTKYVEGADVRVSAGSKSGYTFKKWLCNVKLDGVDLTKKNITFKMPGEDVKLEATWEKEASKGGSGHGGSHSLDEIKGGRYDNLPKDDEKPVIGSDNVADPSNPFVDVATSDPYYDAIMEVYKKGWMVGISDNTFASSGTLTRGMAAQILWNKAGNPAPAGVSPFLDVTSDKWYATAIAWAYEQGLVLGYDGTTFGPDDFVTTEQFTIMLDKLAGNTPAPYVGGAANATRGWVANEIVK